MHIVPKRKKPSARNKSTDYIMKLLPLLRRQFPKERVRCEVDHTTALELMVGVILSAQSTDKRVNLVTKELFKKYRTAADYLKVRPDIFEKEIYSTGFFRAKSKSIRGACQMIVEKFGGEVPKTKEELMELPGIGSKSANVIMGAFYGKSTGVVVDTHMTRLADRLQLSDGTDPAKIEEDLNSIVPQKDWIFFSQAMVLLGRYVCIARTPRCFECKLVPICPYPDKNLFPND